MSDHLGGEGGGGQREALAAGISSILLSGIAFAYLIPQGIGPIGSDPTILAMIGSLGLAVFGTLLTISGLRMPPSSEAAAKEGGGSRLLAIGLMGISFAYAFALDWLGFMAASYVALVALLLLLGVRSILALALVPAAVVAGIYLGIELALGAPLPEGRIDWFFAWQRDAGSLNG